LIEVEIKIPIKDLSKLRDRLRKLGAHFQGSHREIDEYYNHPCRDFTETDEALRIRCTDNDLYHLTYKGPKFRPRTKTRLEVHTPVKNGEEVTEILEKLGFSKVATVKKIREWWELEGFMVFLDEVEDLGNFVEVELEVAFKDRLEEAEERLFKLLTKLDVDRASAIRKSYLELILEKQ